MRRWRRRDRSDGTVDLHLRCEELVRDLAVDRLSRLSIDELCSVVGERRGRAVRLVPLRLPVGSPDGLWISTSTEEFIVFEERLAPIHGRQVILHELGHALCDHQATEVMTEDSSRLLLPSLDPDTVRRTLGREHSRTEAEIEAEYVGTLLSTYVNSWATPREQHVPPELQELAKRLSALEHPSSREP
ncbi:ImmA/IrrE family metallo-endopeptidase [Streptomyces sp. NPDC012693]|uniref:ImmA/IrrE family metallo-endopeptidase n=1 Tax=Streptomyces sp. NPDC012693 TaxID=3364844 RepID=UPI00369ED177